MSGIGQMRQLGTFAVSVLLAVGCTLSDSANSTSSPATRPSNATEAFEACMSAWDGNHDGFEALIRDVLNDPGSMETHGTFYDASDSISDGEILIRLNYGARNAFGGMVRSDAIGIMDVDTCKIIDVITYGN